MKRTLIFAFLGLIGTLAGFSQSAKSDSLYLQAKHLFDLKQYKKSVEAFRTLLELDKEEAPDNTELHGFDKRYLAHALYKSGKTEEAKKEEPCFYELLPPDRITGRRAIKYSYESLKAEKLEDKILWAERALTEEMSAYGMEDPALIGSYNNLSGLYYSQGDSTRCREYIALSKELGSKINLSSQSWRANPWLMEASLETALGNTEKAKNSLAKGAELIGEDVTFSPIMYGAMLSIEYELYGQTDYGHVAGVMQKAFDAIMACDDEQFREFGEIIRPIAWFSINLGPDRYGTEALERILGLMDEDHEHYSFLLYDYGCLKNAYGYTDEAESIFIRAMELAEKQNPGNPGIRLDFLERMSQVYDNNRQYDKAKQAIREAIKICKKFGTQGEYKINTLTHMLAALSTRTNDFQQARNYLADCIKRMDRLGGFNAANYAYMYSEMGKCWYSEDRPQAMENFKKALSLIPEPTTLEEIQLYTTIALEIIYEESTDADDAERKLEQLADKTCRDDIVGIGRRARLYGDFVGRTASHKNMQQSLRIIDKAIELGEQIRGMNILDYYQMKSMLLCQMGNGNDAWDIADKAYEMAIEKYGRSTPQHIQSLMVYQALMQYTSNPDRIEQLKSWGEDLLIFANQMNPSDPQKLGYLIPAAKCIQMNDPQRSKEILETALNNFNLKLFNKQSFHLSNLYIMLSYLDRNSGNLESSLNYCRKALELSEEWEDSTYKVSLYNEVGQSFMASNKLAESEKYFLQAEKMGLSVSENMLELANVYSNLAEVYKRLGQVSKFHEYQKKYNQMLGPLENNPGLTLMYRVQNVWTKYELGQKEECLADIEYISNVYEKHPGQYQPLPYRLKAIYYMREGDLEEAKKWIDLALENSEFADDLNIAANIYARLQDYDKAFEITEKLVNGIQDFYGPNAFENFSPNMMMGELYGYTNDFHNSYLQFRRCFDVAVNYIDNSILTFTSKQRADFWQTANPFFRQYLPFVTATHDYEPEMNGLIYDAVLFSNGMLLNADRSIAEIIQKTSPEIKSLYSQYVAKKELLQKTSNNFDQFWKYADNKTEEDIDKVFSMQEEVEKIQHETEEIEKDLMTRIREQYSDKLVNKTYTWKDVQKRLPARGAAVEYLDFTLDSVTNAIAALVLKKDMVQPEFRVLYHMSRNEQKSIEDLYTSTELGDSIINGLEDLLADCTDLYFASQGVLCSIAVESLPRSQSSIPDNLRLYRLSSTALLADKQRKRKDFKASFFGGLRYDTSVDSLIVDADQYPELRDRSFVADNFFRAKREGFTEIEYLPGTLKEVEGLAELFKKSKRQTPIMKIGNEGTESAFKALSGKYGSILHVSTHGFYNTEGIINNPNNSALTLEDRALEQSGLLMAGASHRFFGDEELPDNLDDGILKASEIAKLDLSGVDIAVLSACETGLGEITGDGVFGLQRGFKKAGTNSILMSLWKVDDDATSALMNEFYANWLGGKTKYESLELAKEKIRNVQKWSAPKYWAAFILLDGIN